MAKPGDILLAPKGTPGYTGQYRVNAQGILCAMQPDGQWVGIKAYKDFPSKKVK